MSKKFEDEFFFALRRGLQQFNEVRGLLRIQGFGHDTKGRTFCNMPAIRFKHCDSPVVIALQKKGVLCAISECDGSSKQALPVSGKI
jgi:hypothetical protein